MDSHIDAISVCCRRSRSGYHLVTNGRADRTWLVPGYLSSGGYLGRNICLWLGASSEGQKPMVVVIASLGACGIDSFVEA